MPSELRGQLEELATKDVQFEEGRKALFKKRNLYLRADEKGLESALQAALLRKTEKEQVKLLAMIDEKVEIEGRLLTLVEQHLNRLETELKGKLSMDLGEYVFADIFADIPDAMEPRTSGVGLPNTGMVRSRSSPKKR